MLDPVLHAFPLWLVGLLFLAATLLAREVGVRIYQWSVKRGAGTEAKSESDAKGHIIGSIFGLLAFMVGFTFSIAIDRYDTRRGLVTEEANAISTTYLRASLFDEPHRAQIQSLLHQYARTRIAPEGLWDERVEAQVKASLDVRNALWDAAHDALMPVRETDQASYFLEATNETFNVGTRRQLLGSAHIPTRIIDVMLLYLLVSAGVLGFLMGGRPSGQRLASTLLLALFSVAIVLILDVDRPRSGTITVPQRAMEELVATLDRDQARRGQAPSLQSPVDQD
jgi:hypothetical protein